MGGWCGSLHLSMEKAGAQPEAGPAVSTFPHPPRTRGLPGGEKCGKSTRAFLWVAPRGVVAKSPDRLAYVVPKEGGTLWIDNLAIPKTARNLDSAYTFLDYVLKPDVAATIVNGVHYAGANQAALPLIDAGIRQDPAI